MKRISFYTFGCRLNQSETASIENSFERNGYQVVGFDAPSDIVVINTCTVTEGGDADTRHLVNKIARDNPQARIALVGCQAQVQKERLSNMPNVRWIVGNQHKMDLVNVFAQHPDPTTTELITPTIERKPFTQPVSSIDRQHTRANIKIQDGCDFFCSFCEIPYARGRARSRVFEDILVEARSLVAAGHKEIIVTGINVGTYEHDGKNLLDVLKALHDVDGLARIRISSIEPTTIPLEILDLMNQGKLCRYLHIPLQSGNDEILGMMKRKYLTSQFSDFVNHAYARVPGICIGTDVIVGFPGETDAHFEETVRFLSEMPIHYFHVFSYSPRHMAQSRLLETFPAQVISERSRTLRELSARQRRRFHESFLGQAVDVLVEHDKEDSGSGLTDHFIRVKFSRGTGLFNQIVPMRLISLEGQCVLGEIL